MIYSYLEKGSIFELRQIMVSDETISKLIEAAKRARENAYAPYSRDFKVGAAVLTEDGSIFDGCNVENASFGATMCAERVAIFKAVCEGKRRIIAVAVVAESSNPIPPCGACLQVISEFGSDADIIMANTTGKFTTSSMKQMLPFNFRLEQK